MKNICRPGRSLWLIISLTLYVPVAAQESFVQKYLDELNEYAVIYSGELEEGYSLAQYQNFPYYQSPEFVTGTIMFNRNDYPAQQLRLDLYRNQLVVLVPGKQFSKIVDNYLVEQVEAYGKTIIRYTSPMDNGLGAGYYFRLYHSPAIELLQQVTADIDKKIIGDRKQFIFQEKYYLLYQGNNYQLRNKKSFTRLFPQYKKEINRFAKDNKLNFGKQKEQSFKLLAEYCDQLINQKATP